MSGRFKKITVYVISLVAIAVMAVFTYLLSGHISASIGFVIAGIAPMILAIPMHILGKKAKIFYIASILLNLFGTSIFTAMYYTATSQEPTLAKLIIACVGAASVLTVTYVFLHIFPRFTSIVSILGVVLTVVASVYNIVRWVQSGQVLYSFGFFALTVAFMYLLAMLCITETPTIRATRYASFAGFGIFIVIAAVVLFIVSEGDLLEGVFEGGADLVGDSIKGKKKRK